MNLIKRISLKTAGYLNIAAILAAIMTHLLVIFQIMPYTWINGGRSENFPMGQRTSLISIGILVVMLLINFWACGLIPIKKALMLLKVLLWILFVYSVFGLVQQLFGTTFEKFFMSILCLINVLMYFRLAIEKRPPTK